MFPCLRYKEQLLEQMCHGLNPQAVIHCSVYEEQAHFYTEGIQDVSMPVLHGAASGADVSWAKSPGSYTLLCI
jgi:hypothetical protein